MRALILRVVLKGMAFPIYLPLFLGLGIFSFPTNPALAQSCEPQKLPSIDQRSSAYRIQFLKSKDVYLIGRRHGNHSQIQKDFRRLFSQKTISNERFLQLGFKFLRGHRETLNSRRRNLHTMMLHLDPDKVDYIGLELSAKELAVWKSLLKNQSQQIQDAFGKRGLEKHPIKMNIKLLVLGEGALWLENHSNRKIPFVSLEGANKDSVLSRRIYNQKFYRKNAMAFRRKIHSVTVAKHEITLAEKAFVHLTQNYGDYLHEAQFLNNIWIESVERRLSKILTSTLQKLRPFFQNLLLRDSAVVREVLKDPRSGVVLFGQGHIQNLVERLSEKCRGGQIQPLKISKVLKP